MRWRPADHAGSKSSARDEVNCRRWPPEDLIVNRLPSLVNTMRPPDGDHAGSRASTCLVSRRLFEPSASITQIDPDPNGALVRQKAIREPAGFQAGPNSFRS